MILIATNTKFKAFPTITTTYSYIRVGLFHFPVVLRSKKSFGWLLAFTFVLLCFRSVDDVADDDDDDDANNDDEDDCDVVIIP